MRLLLDTQVLLWWLADEGLTDQARDAVADPANPVMVSAVSAWEISIKKSLGKLTAPDDLERQVVDGGFIPLPATYVVDRAGIVRYAFVDIDFTRRAEPAAVVAALKQVHDDSD